MDAKLFVGGTPNPLFPNHDGSKQFVEPHARRIAGEYGTGEFTLGYPLAPGLLPWQRVELEKANLQVGEHILMYSVPELHEVRSVVALIMDSDARQAGATIKPIAMLYDAETHTYSDSTLLDSLFDNLPLDEDYVGYGVIGNTSSDDVSDGTAVVTEQTGTVTGQTGTLAAFNLSVDDVALTDADGKVYTMSGTIPVPEQSVTISDGTVTVSGQNAQVNANGSVPYFVPQGKTLILGFRVTALPTDTTVSLAAMKIHAALVVKAGGFDFPSEI